MAAGSLFLSPGSICPRDCFHQPEHDKKTLNPMCCILTHLIDKMMRLLDAESDILARISQLTFCCYFWYFLETVIRHFYWCVCIIIRTWLWEIFYLLAQSRLIYVPDRSLYYCQFKEIADASKREMRGKRKRHTQLSCKSSYNDLSYLLSGFCWDFCLPTHHQTEGSSKYSFLNLSHKSRHAPWRHIGQFPRELYENIGKNAVIYLNEKVTIRKWLQSEPAMQPVW